MVPFRATFTSRFVGKRPRGDCPVVPFPERHGHVPCEGVATMRLAENKIGKWTVTAAMGLAVGVVLCLGFASRIEAAPASDEVTFTKGIAPLLQRSCEN